MNNHNEYGSLIAADKNQQPVIIEWYKTDILSSQLADFKKEVSDLAAQETAATEKQFLQINPHAVSSGGFLRSCESFFAQGIDNVDWNGVEQTLQASIKQFYLADLSKFGSEIINMLKDDVYFFASIKDQQTNKLLGFIMAAITPALAIGDIKLINLIISSDEHERGLEALLLAGLIKAMPQVKRIFTVLRPTNQQALEMFEEYGFTKDENPVQDPHHPIDKEHFIILECKANQSDVSHETGK